MLQKLKQQALRLADCQCGQYKESYRTYEPGIVYLHYDRFPHEIYPISKHCRHRSIEKALILAYKAGKNGTKPNL